MKTCTIIAAIIFLSIPLVKGQEMNQPELDLQQYIEDIFSAQDDDIDYSELYESFLQHYIHPIDLNRTDRDQLKSLFLLTDTQIDAFYTYIAANGRLVSIYELQAIPGFDPITIQQISPFVTVSSTDTDTRPLLQRILHEKNNYLLMRYEGTVQDKRGYSDSTGYLGSPAKLYTRFRVSRTRDFSLGFTAEKDAGEQLTWDPDTKRYGADFYSFHAQLQNKGALKNIVIGDYQMQFGQGLVLNSGFGFGKGSETVATVRKNNLGIMPYTSVLEAEFFRGGAATFTIAQFDVSGFYSFTQRDANLSVSDTLENEIDQFITSLQVTGMHRTPSELEKKYQIDEQNYGGNINYTSSDGDFNIGGTFLHTQYSVPLQKNATYYNGFEFSGKQNSVGSLSSSLQWQNINVFGELAMSTSGGVGAIAGVMMSLSNHLDMAMALRQYDRDFHSLYGNGFGENTRTINESGVYWGFKYRPITRLQCAAYFDTFSFPWLKSGVKSPSNGYEYFLKSEYAFSKKIKMYAQFREETKSANSRAETQFIDQVIEGTKRNFVFNTNYTTNDQLSFKTRAQYSTYQFGEEKTSGFALMQDITIAVGKFKLSGRYALFDTDDYDNRQYVYEKDVLYAFSIPAYSGIGVRSYLVFQYKHSKKMQFWVKYTNTHYKDRETIGTGREEIDGNTKQDLKLQMKISF